MNKIKLWFGANILGAVSATALIILGMTVAPALLLVGATLALGTYISTNQWIGVNRLLNQEVDTVVEDNVTPMKEELFEKETAKTAVKSNVKEAENADILEK